MSIATDVRAYAELALQEGRRQLSQAGTAVANANKRLATDGPKPVLAALGVADMVAESLGKQAEVFGKRVEALGKRVEALPADAVENAAKAQETGKALLNRTQDDALSRITELRERLDVGVDSVRALPMLSVTAASTTTVYLSNARHVFDKLAARGEVRLAELRNDPRVTRVLGDLDEASTALQARLAPVLGSVRSEVVPYLDSAVDAIKDADLGEPAEAPRARRTSGTRQSTSASRRSTTGTTSASAGRTARSTAAKRAGAAKSGADTATKAAARKAPASKSTTRKAPVAKTGTTTRKAPAAKSGTTTRKAPAKKA
ncbi:MAG TPA: hypothetical protein VGX49_11290 [Jatrophihabitans sp.]|jgi:hypothetical protein|nr:hypothetical protein [Jatrophihabitans sp.]